MKRKTPTDEELMAFADGMLEPSQSDAILRLIAVDPALEKRVEAYRRSRLAVAGALKPLADEPVPPALHQAILEMIGGPGNPQGQNVVSFKPRAGRAWAYARPVAIAASVAALAFGLAGYYLGGEFAGEGTSGSLAAGKPLSGEMQTSLGRDLAGTERQTSSGLLRMIATFKAGDGAVCREFDVKLTSAQQTIAGVACREDQQWILRIAVATAAGSDGFAPASALSVLDEYLVGIDAGEALTASEEAGLLKPL